MQTEGGSRCNNFFESLILILLKCEQSSSTLYCQSIIKYLLYLCRLQFKKIAFLCTVNTFFDKIKNIKNILTFLNLKKIIQFQQIFTV